MSSSTKKLCVDGLLIALVCVATMVIQIPIAGTGGYIHPGDSMIFLAAVFFGKRHGAVAGGLGSALADLLSGYAHWALFSLIIKGLIGYLAGSLADYSKHGQFFSFRNVLGTIAAALWMVIGYLLAGTVLNTSFTVALASVPANLLQAFGGYVIYVALGLCLHRAHIYRITGSL